MQTCRRMTFLVLAGTILVVAFSLSVAGASVLPSGSTARIDSSLPPAYVGSGSHHPGVYVFYDTPADDPAVQHNIGGHRSHKWYEIEPSEGVFNWGKIDGFLADEAAHGKPAALGLQTYAGIPGEYTTPQWVVNAGMRPIYCYTNGKTYIIPRYWDSVYLQKYGDFIAAYGARYRNDPRLAWVQIGAGIWEETQPAYPNRPACVQAVKDALDSDFGYTNDTQRSWKWVEVVETVAQMYRDAFGNDMPVLLQNAPKFINGWEGDEWGRYAGEHGIGLKHNGLLADHMAGNGTYHSAQLYWDRVPIGFESYSNYLPTSTDVYWGVLAGLDKHADYFNFARDLFQNGVQYDLSINRAAFDFANTYAGRTLADTPDVWTALRDTEQPWGEHGNFDFWLYQEDDAPGGRTVVVTDANPSAKEGRFTRRTNQGTGNPYMYFDIDNGYLFDATQSVTVTVTYFDWNNDRWELLYDSHSGEKAATPVGSANPWVQKGNDYVWKQAIFVIHDGRFSDGLSAYTDFRIDSRSPTGSSDGDEYIHTVHVQKGDSAPLPGDFDGDCDVDTADLGQVLARWGSQQGGPSYDPGFDLNSDGKIDLMDVMNVAASVGQTC